MKSEFISLFTAKWKKYFKNAELPVIFYYSNEKNDATYVEPSKEWHCLIKDLKELRAGKSLCYSAESFGCAGGKRYTGFSTSLSPKFKYFLSCGIPSEMEGERYKQTPEIVLETLKQHKNLNPPGKYLIFKPWDKLNESDNPDGVIFFAKNDVLAGLFTLATFDQTDPNSTITPFGAGCSSIVYYPFLEKDSDNPKAVIGMFDPSARPAVGGDELTFTVPMKKFEKMISYMDESFLITPTWDRVKERIT